MTELGRIRAEQKRCVEDLAANGPGRGAENGALDWMSEELFYLREESMKAPFPWFGGKSRVAHVVWPRFGDVPNYVEPFAGSLAVLLKRPHPPRAETVNDLDCMIANFWRALQHDPEAVADHADWPVNEADLHARHRWLVDQEDFRERMITDPEFYDPKIAGWWVWGISQWIGSGWCSRPEWGGRGNGSGAPRGVHRKMPRAGGGGVSAKRPQLGRGFKDDVGGIALGVKEQIPHLSGSQGINVCGNRVAIHSWFTALAERLRHTRVCCGEWDRILGPSPTFKIGMTGVFLDPPYASERDVVYNVESFDVAHRAQEWAVANGDNPLLRIALCGYEGDYEMPGSWECVRWKAVGGYGARGEGRGRANAGRERIWFSPACVRPPSLFAELDGEEDDTDDPA